MIKMAGKRLPRLLRIYENSDFGLQERARFFYNLMIIMSVGMMIVVIYSSVIQLIGPDFGYFYFPVLLSEILIFFFILLSLFLLIKGKFKFSTHMLIGTSILSVWTIMILDKSSVLVRFDTIVYIIAVLSMLPLMIQRGRVTLQIYGAANLILLVIFILIAGKQLNLPLSVKIEYFLDVSISTTFVVIVGYNIFIINRKAHERAVADIRELHEAEKALLESEKKYNETTDLLPQTIYEADANGKLKYVNANGFKAFGYKPEDLINGINLLELLHESHRKTAQENIAKILKR
jgi:PAS domain-containing protein